MVYEKLESKIGKLYLSFLLADRGRGRIDTASRAGSGLRAAGC